MLLQIVDVLMVSAAGMGMTAKCFSLIDWSWRFNSRLRLFPASILPFSLFFRRARAFNDVSGALFAHIAVLVVRVVVRGARTFDR